jgi:hypothetical protein
MKKAYQFLGLAILVAMSLSSCYNEDNKIALSCNDGVLNQGEEFVDCGGPNCDPCPPSCFNGVLDFVDGWQEVGIDCGGPCEEEGFFCCENGIQDTNPFDPTLSENWVDCKLDGLAPGEVGSNSECPICETCTNGIHDDGETMMYAGNLIDVVDCDDNPSTSCPPCSQLCNDGLLNGFEEWCGIDCGGVCLSCQFAAQCNNGIQDVYPNDPGRSEEGVDCGGCACAPCSELCMDGILNGTEEAPDCGGDFCPACNDPILCGDGVQNGYETGIDCYDGADGASGCPPCQDLCFDTILNGVETDTDCGGPDCPACANDIEYMSYEVNGVLYESRIGTIISTRVPGTIAIADEITFSGGSAHNISFTIKDNNVIPMSFSTGEFILNNTDLTAFNNCTFIDNDLSTYQSVTDPIGITVNITSIQYLAPPPLPAVNNNAIEGTFEGRVYALGLGTLNITNGVFRVLMQN